MVRGLGPERTDVCCPCQDWCNVCLRQAESLLQPLKELLLTAVDGAVGIADTVGEFIRELLAGGVDDTIRCLLNCDLARHDLIVKVHQIDGPGCQVGHDPADLRFLLVGHGAVGEGRCDGQRNQRLVNLHGGPPYISSFGSSAGSCTRRVMPPVLTATNILTASEASLLISSTSISRSLISWVIRSVAGVISNPS